MSEFTSWINVWIFTEICIHLRCGTLLYFNCIPSFNKQIFGIWGNVCTQLENVQVVGSSRGCYLPALLMKGTARKRACSLSRKLNKLMSGPHLINHDVRTRSKASELPHWEPVDRCSCGSSEANNARAVLLFIFDVSMDSFLDTGINDETISLNSSCPSEQHAAWGKKKEHLFRVSDSKGNVQEGTVQKQTVLKKFQKRACPISLIQQGIS